MRPVYPSDLDAVARALMACTPTHRRELAIRIIEHADVADRYRRRLGKLHPEFGAGTLSSAAQAYPRTERPDHCTQPYLECLAVVLDALIVTSGDRVS